jgi:hypothetical protein
VGGYDIAIGGTPASVTIAELATPGAGKLVLPAAAVTFTATAGGGKIAYAAAPASLTLSSTTGLTYVGNLSVTGAVSLAGNLTVTGTATLGGTLTNTAEAVATFNGATTVTGVVTPGTGGLTIAGTGVVRLEELPVISTNALSIGNTAGVFIAGALATGSSSNTVTLTNAVFQSGNATPISLTSASGSGITLLAGDALALNTDDTIVIANSGAITLGTGAEISGAGTWTAASGEDEYLAIAVVDETTAFIGASLADGTTGAEVGTLTASAGTPAITVKAEGTLVIGPRTTVALGGDNAKVGSIVLTHDSTAARIVFAGAGAKISTALTSGNTKVTDTIAGGIKANSGAVGNKLEVYSTAANGSDLKLGSIVPASDATFNGTDNVITGPTAAANTSIDGTLTVTAT